MNYRSVVTLGIYSPGATAAERACLIVTFGLLDDLPATSTPVSDFFKFVYKSRTLFTYNARPRLTFKHYPDSFRFKIGDKT
jgi:hypothetical protein